MAIVNDAASANEDDGDGEVEEEIKMKKPRNWKDKVIFTWLMMGRKVKEKTKWKSVWP